MGGGIYKWSDFPSYAFMAIDSICISIYGKNKNKMNQFCNKNLPFPHKWVEKLHAIMSIFFPL
jgi:hypothetical protein